MLMAVPASCQPTSRRHIWGFSVIELVIVLVLIAVLAVFVVPRMVSTQAITLPAVAAQLAANVRYAQSMTMSKGQRYRINFTANSYQITDMSGLPIIQPVTASTAAISVSPVVLSGFNPPLTSNYVAFDSRGIPYINATTALAASAVITLTSGTETVTVTVAAETGGVK